MRARGVEELFLLRASCAVEPCLGSCSCPKFLVQYLPSCLLHQFAYCLDSRRHPRVRDAMGSTRIRRVRRTDCVVSERRL